MSIYGGVAFAIHHTFLISREVCDLAITPSGSVVTLHAVRFLGSSSTQVLQSHVLSTSYTEVSVQCPLYTQGHINTRPHLLKKLSSLFIARLWKCQDLQGAETICEVSHLHFLLRW